jgi:transposase InsO family protein
VRVRYGYRRIHILLRREGWNVNAKRVYRLYRQEGLSLHYKRAKKRVSVPRVTPPPATRPNERWSIDSLKDRLLDGRPFRVFTVVDNVSKVSPAIVADFSIKGEQVVAVLDRLKAGGLPQRLAVDNGPEFISKALDAWAYQEWRTARILPPWQADRQCVRGIVQRAFPAGMPGSALVRVAGGGAAGDRGMADRVQHGAAAPGARAADTGRDGGRIASDC